MKALFAPRRATEATAAQIMSTGAMAGTFGRDPVDGDVGWKQAGRPNRDVPYWTREKAVVFSIASYRVNPMARAIIDTYTAFCVGDSGVSWQCTNEDVAKVVDEFWADSRNCMDQQELQLRSQLIMGERLLEMMVGKRSGVVRYSPIDPSAITDVGLLNGNAMWPSTVYLGNTALVDGVADRSMSVVSVNDKTGLRDGKAMFWTPFKTLETDVRSMPFLMPVLDWLDNYDMVLSNLMDRTTLARYLVWDVTVTGGQQQVDEFIKGRGGLHAPPSGSVEVHSDSVEWKPQYATTGADEDSATSKLAMTNIAAGTGLARTWLADPEDANRATSLSMAEPVRRRVAGVQKIWLSYQTEMLRFVVDRAVAAGRLPETVESSDPRTGAAAEMRASQTVTVTGPEVAAADAQLTAQVLLNLSTGLQAMKDAGLLSDEALQVAAKKAWEDYVGVPYRADLGAPDANPDDVAQAVDDARGEQTPSQKAAYESRIALVR